MFVRKKLNLLFKKIKRERCLKKKKGKKNSWNVLTQKLPAYNKACPNTITTPTTRVAAELSPTIFCHVFK